MATANKDQNEIWETFQPLERGEGEGTLVVDVDGFEGPLDLLLSLARSQKVDITRISILALAEQYLTYIEELRKLRLEVAADYLVMAAWLAFLKSKLLLPEVEEDEPTGEEMAAELAFRLQRLEAMRDAAARLANRDRLGRDVFSRGDPEPVEIVKTNEFSATLYDLLSAYAARRQEQSISIVHVRKRKVWSLQEARDLLTSVIGSMADWAPMSVFLSPYLVDDETRTTVTASAFGASLELVREGQIELRQTDAFAPLYLRDREPVARITPEAENG